MKILLDTHALIWFLEDDPSLSLRARTAIETAGAVRKVSHASAWEIAIKVSLGKLRLPIPFEELVPGRVESLRFEWLPIFPAHLHRLIDLPFHHRDPFDRLLIAQAQAEKLTLVSRDPWFVDYGVPVLW